MTKAEFFNAMEKAVDEDRVSAKSLINSLCDCFDSNTLEEFYEHLHDEGFLV